MGGPTHGFPFEADYAKSGRSSCRTSKEKIEQGTLRIAQVVQSPHHDGMQQMWHIPAHFFAKGNRGVDSTERIFGFDSLRPEDQSALEGYIGKGGDKYGEAKKAAKKASEDAGSAGGAGAAEPAEKKKGKKAAASGAGAAAAAAAKPNGKAKKETKKEKDARLAAECLEAEQDALKVRLTEQSAALWTVKDLAEKSPTALSTGAVKDLLEINGLASNGGRPDLLTRLAEIVYFGVPPCGDRAGGCCGGRPLRFNEKTCRYVSLSFVPLLLLLLLLRRLSVCPQLMRRPAGTCARSRVTGGLASMCRMSRTQPARL